MNKNIILFLILNICILNISFSQFYSANSAYRYVAATDTVEGNWKDPGYDDSAWDIGKGSLDYGYPGATNNIIPANFNFSWQDSFQNSSFTNPWFFFPILKIDI